MPFLPRILTRRAFSLLLASTIAVIASWGCSKGSPVAPSPGPSSSTSPSAVTCEYTIAPADRARSVGAAGAEFSIPVTAAAGCAWSVVPDAAFITTASIAHDGSGSADVHVMANNGAARTGTVTIAGQAIEVSQAAAPQGGCDVTVTPAEAVVRASGDTLALAVNAASGCTWTVTSSDRFIVPRAGAGLGSAELRVDVQSNPGRPRKGSLSIGTALVTIAQDGTTDCVTNAAASRSSFGAQGGSGTVTVSASSACDWTAETASDAVRLATLHSGSGDGEFGFEVGANSSASSRTMSIRVGTRTLDISQAGAETAPAPPAPPTSPTPPSSPQPPSLPGPSNSSVSLFAFTSQPGDYVGAGGTRNDVAPAAEIDVSPYSSRAELNVLIRSTDGTVWTVTLGAASGRTLMPGTFDGATRFGSASAPKLDIGGGGRGCNALTGRFIVHTADYGPGDTIRRLDASFEQHCEGAAPALIGQIVIAPAAPSLPPPTTTPTRSALTFTSDPGDYIGAGLTWSYVSPTATFTSAGAYGNEAVVTVTGSGLGDTWTIRLVGPGGARPTPGLYEAATRYPPGGPLAGFSLSGNGRGCNMLTATFRVYDIAFGPGGVLQRLQATFEQHCEGKTPASRGEVVYIAGS